MDWDNSYYTMSDENNYTIWGFLKKLFDGRIRFIVVLMLFLGLVDPAHLILRWRLLKGGNLLLINQYLFDFQSKIAKNEYLLVWTTTPWTLTSNVMAGVNGNLDYVKT